MAVESSKEPLLYSTTQEQDVHSNEESLQNEEDLLPTPPRLRTFTSLDMASLWWGVVTSISTFYLAGSLVEQGMAWWQGLVIVIVANIIQCFVAVLMGHAGAKYGVAFPVQCRAALGKHGAHFATFIRGLIACGWFGIDTWIGGQAIFIFINALWSGKLSEYSTISWLGISLPELGCFFLFWLLQLPVIWHGIDGIRYLEKYSSPILLALCVAILVWAYLKAGGFGEMLSASSKFGEHDRMEFWMVLLSGLTANVGTFSTVSLSICDFTRYARSQTDQILGQVGIPLFVGTFSFIGLAVSSSTQKIFGYIISNPTELLAHIGGVVPTLISLFGVTLAILTTNVYNIVAPANALVNVNPRRISFRTGALLTAAIGLLMQPWRMYQTGNAFLNAWLLGYSFVIGPLAGIILVDYYILRRCHLDVPALYGSSNAITYHYFKGYNWRAFAAYLVGALSNLLGFLYTLGVIKGVPFGWLLLYNLSWFSSFFLAALSFWLFSQLPKSMGHVKVAIKHRNS